MKRCIICQKEILDRSWKYCPECKKKEHLEQMHQNYVKNTHKWQFDGEYWNNRNPQQLLGTGGLGGHKSNNHTTEMRKIQSEMQQLGLRQKNKPFWRQ